MNKTIKATKKIDPKLIKYLNKLLSQTKWSNDHGDLIEKFTVKFDDYPDIEADIKICNGDGPFVDPVLFFKGQEVDVIQDPSDDICGEYIFEYEDTTFVVNIVAE